LIGVSYRLISAERQRIKDTAYVIYSASFIHSFIRRF